MAENKFHENLRSLRKQSGHTLVSLAQQLRVSKSAISDYENKLSEPTLTFIERAAAFFQVDIQTLIHGQNSDNSKESKHDEPLRILILNQRIDALTAQIEHLHQLNQSKDSEISALRMQIMLLKDT